MEHRSPQRKPNVINVAEAWQAIWDEQPPDGLDVLRATHLYLFFEL
jgi:hypothetical protein